MSERYSVLALTCCCLLFGVSSASADERKLSAELANGVIVFGDGPSPQEAGLSLDVGLSMLVARYFLGRAALGYAPIVDRHSPENFVRVRLEGALRAKVGDLFVPLLGVGGALWNRSPSVHGLLGLGFQISPNWQLGVDIRSGLFWDREEQGRPHLYTLFGEGQFRVSWAFK